jgi:hypothetical protein
VVSRGVAGDGRQCVAKLTPRYTIYKDHVTLQDYEINDGMSLEMY